MRNGNSFVNFFTSHNGSSWLFITEMSKWKINERLPSLSCSSMSANNALMWSRASLFRGYCSFLVARIIVRSKVSKCDAKVNDLERKVWRHICATSESFFRGPLQVHNSRTSPIRRSNLVRWFLSRELCLLCGNFGFFSLAKVEVISRKTFLSFENFYEFRQIPSHDFDSLDGGRGKSCVSLVEWKIFLFRTFLCRPSPVLSLFRRLLLLSSQPIVYFFHYAAFLFPFLHSMPPLKWIGRICVIKLLREGTKARHHFSRLFFPASVLHRKYGKSSFRKAFRESGVLFFVKTEGLLIVSTH